MRAARIQGVSAITGMMLAVSAGFPAAAAGSGVHAGASPRWRVVKYFGACASQGTQSVAATGADDAWATGQAFGFQCDRPGLLIARWDGRSWRQLPPPPGFSGVSHDSIGFSVAALSASYSWTFVTRAPSVRSWQSFALLRSGHRWRAFRLTAEFGLAVNSAGVFSRSDAWAFGNISYAAYAARFNGRSWRRVPVPVNPSDATFAGARNI